MYKKAYDIIQNISEGGLKHSIEGKIPENNLGKT